MCPRGDAPVVGLARREPAVDHRQYTAVSGRFVGQLRPNPTHRGVGHGTAECPPTHALFHRGHIQVLDNDVAVAARQLGGELVGGLPPKTHTPAMTIRENSFTKASAFSYSPQPLRQHQEHIAGTFAECP